MSVSGPFDNTMASSSGNIISALTDHGHIFIFSYSLKRKALVSWSKNAEELLGVRDSDVAMDGNLFLRHVHPDDRFVLLNDLERALKGEIGYRCTYRWIRPDNNELRWLHCRGALTEPLALGEALFEGIIMDLSAEFTGPVARLAGPDSLTSILAAFPTTVFTLDNDLRIFRINRTKDQEPFSFGNAGFDVSQFKPGKVFLSGFLDLDERAVFEKILRNLLDRTTSSYRTRVSNESSVYSFDLLPITSNDAVEGILGIISDITEIVRLEERLSGLQKTEGLRLLAAGVAHNFNNALQTIVGHASAMNSHPEHKKLVVQSTEAILETVHRASELTRQMLSLDDSSRKAPNPIDLNLAAMSALNRIESIFNGKIKVSVLFGNPAPVRAVQDDLISAIEALLLNARDAMKAGGDLSIKTSQVTLSEFQVADLHAGTYSKLKISDSGSGMAAEVRKRALEPFFTTKERDPVTGVGLKGSGLGMSHAFGVIRGLGGALVIESEPDHGTSIFIYIPSETQNVHKYSEEVIAKESSTKKLLVLSPTILIVDDDAMILETISAILRDAGYFCASAEDATTAFKIAKSNISSLKLALIDAAMPGMDSPSLVRRLLKLSDSLKVVGFSGATMEYTTPLLDAGALRILTKPADSKSILAMIDELLNNDTKAVAGI